jgi:hypothetical protein
MKYSRTAAVCDGSKKTNKINVRRLIAAVLRRFAAVLKSPVKSKCGGCAVHVYAKPPNTPDTLRRAD